MNEMPVISGREDQLVKHAIASFDGPAYMRRARQVQHAYEDLLGRCCKQRVEWLALVRVRLGILKGLADDWSNLRPYLAEEKHTEHLKQMYEELAPCLRVPVEPTSSRWKLRHALRELTESIDYFNRRWEKYLLGVDVTPVNALRDGYNRYYVLEKECALRSSRLAQIGFTPLKPMTQEELFAAFPLLPRVAVKS